MGAPAPTGGISGLIFAFDLYQDEVAAAIAECIAHQDATGNEMDVLLDCSGNVHGKIIGDASHIKLEQEQLSARPGGLIIHNHPSGASLSAEDCMCAGAFDLTCSVVLVPRA